MPCSDFSNLLKKHSTDRWINYMSTRSKLKQSRGKWKQKAIERGTTARYQRKENFRIKKERDKYKKEAKEAKIRLEKELRKNSHHLSNKVDVVYIALHVVPRVF